MGTTLQKGYVNIYEHTNFRGKMETMGLGFHLVPKNLIGKISSIKIAPKTQIQLNGIGINTLYTNHGKLNLDLYDLGLLNDKITSLLIKEIEDFDPHISKFDNLTCNIFILLSLLIIFIIYIIKKNNYML